MKANIHRLYKDVEFLCTVSPSRNYLNIESLERVAGYIQQEFEQIGFEVEIQKWIAEGNEYKNIIASYNTDKTERLIVGAHYDVCGDQPGADDNASAIAGLLETARLISESQPKIDYRIDFVAYNLEEPPFFATESMGSYIHAQYLKENKIPVLGMICYEMIGYFSDEPGSQKFPTEDLKGLYPDKGNFIVVVGLDHQIEFSYKVYELMKATSAIDVQFITFQKDIGLAGLSDHRNYWKLGYNAVMINDTSFLRNPNYHEQTDTIDTLNFEKMGDVVDSCLRMITQIK